MLLITAFVAILEHCLKLLKKWGFLHVIQLWIHRVGNMADRNVKQKYQLEKRGTDFERKMAMGCVSLIILFISENSAAGFLDDLKRQVESTTKEVAESVLVGTTDNETSENKQDVTPAVKNQETLSQESQSDISTRPPINVPDGVSNANYPWELVSPTMNYKDINNAFVRSGYKPDQRNDLKCPDTRAQCVLVYTGVMSDEINTRIKVRVLRGDINKITIKSIFPPEKWNRVAASLKNRIPKKMLNNTNCRYFSETQIVCSGIKDVEVSGITTRQTRKGNRPNSNFHDINTGEQGEGNISVRYTYNYI